MSILVLAGKIHWHQSCYSTWWR